MKLVYINRRTNIAKYKNKEVLNLCIYGSFENYFDVNLSEYFNLVKPLKSLEFKNKYLKKIDKIGSELVNNVSGSINKLAQVLSYRTLSKLAVSDNLVDKFWVIEQINSIESSEIIVFVDDIDIYNIYTSGRVKFRISSIVPYKQIYYFILFLVNKLKASRHKYLNSINNNFKLFVGNKFEVNKNGAYIYDEYFFSKYWKNYSNPYLLLNVGEWKPGIVIPQEVLFKESFLSFSDLFNLLFISLKHFIKPLQIVENSIEDCLINRNLVSDVKCGSFIDSYQNFFIYSNVLKFLASKNGEVVIPHEGRSYERIICSVFKNSSISVIGYAHFPVSERILNYYYGNFESFIYNKFSFYTLSENNFNQFKDLYKWPISKFKIGAHLKSKPFKPVIVNSKSFDVLILLGNELNQNIKLLSFVKNSLWDEEFKILVRLHPSSRGLNHLKQLFLKFNFIRIEHNSLSEDVELSKIIVYGDTGAAIDCLNFNVPLCYIYDDNCLLSDRIYEEIDGHFRFRDINEFRLMLPALLESNTNVSFETIKHKYISPINPELFSFE
jgi:hypothetical protein